MNIDTIIGMIDALKQASYELGYMNSDIDTMVSYGYMSKGDGENLQDLAEQSQSKQDLVNDIREKIINALNQMEGNGDSDPNTVLWDDFLTLYDPVRNNGYGLETFDDGLASFILDKPPAIPESHIWTVYDLEDGICIMTGKHIIDAIGYIHTHAAWVNGDLEIRLD